MPSVSAAPSSILRSRRAPASMHSNVASAIGTRSEEHTSELQSLMRSSYAVFCLKKKTHPDQADTNSNALQSLHIYYFHFSIHLPTNIGARDRHSLHLCTKCSVSTELHKLTITTNHTHTIYTHVIITLVTT